MAGIAELISAGKIQEARKAVTAARRSLEISGAESRAFGDRIDAIPAKKEGRK